MLDLSTHIRQLGKGLIMNIHGDTPTFLFCSFEQFLRRNHPDQLTGSGDFKANHSGKFIQLAQICETIYEKRERVLVFTQFKEMTQVSRKYLIPLLEYFDSQNVTIRIGDVRKLRGQ